MAEKPKVKRPVANIAYTLTMFDYSKPIAAIALPNNPSEITIEQDFPTNLEYTFGSIPKREHNRSKRWRISISGRTGVESRKMYEEDSETLTPLDILKKYEEFLEDYQERAARAGATQLSRTTGVVKLAARIRCVLAMSKENSYFFVEPGTLQISRTAANARQSAVWSISFVAWGRVTDLDTTLGRGYFGPPYTELSTPAPGKVSLTWALENPNRDEELGKFVSAADWKATNDTILAMQKRSAESRLAEYQQLSAQLSPGTGGPCGILDRALADYFPPATKYVLEKGAAAVDFSKDVYLASLQFRRAVQDFRTQLKSGLDVLKLPQRTLQNMAAGAANMREILQDVYDAGQFVVTGAGIPAVLSMLYMADNACADADALVGGSGGKFKGLPTGAGYSAAAGALSDKDLGFGAPFVLPSAMHSWMDVAQAVYGDDSFWLPLAKLNAAKDAYSDAQGKPLQPGDTIYLPSEGGALVSGGQPNVDSFYLTDLMVTPQGGLSSTGGAYLQGVGAELVAVDGTGGDLMTVTGYANLVQAVATRSQTPQGALSDEPDYGLLRLAPGDELNPHAAATAMAFARAQLLSDHRIADITDPMIEDLVDGIALRFTIVPAGASPEPVEVIAPLPSL